MLKYVRRYFDIGGGADSYAPILPPTPLISPYHSDSMVKRPVRSTLQGRFKRGQDLPANNIDPFGMGFNVDVLLQGLSQNQGEKK